MQHKTQDPTPMNHDSGYVNNLEQTKGPTDATEQQALAHRMNFSYRQAVGELLFAASRCRTDILFHVIKLSQFSSQPDEIHYKAVKNVFRYLRATLDHGLHFWRSNPHPTLPDTPLPKVYKSNYESNSPDFSPYKLTTFVDSDWAGDTSTRKSTTGYALYMAGAPILYKCQLQTIVALSSTEAEFVAVADAGKAVLYIRSIIEQLNIPLPSATPMYVDNQGARLMANNQQPSRRTRHLDIKHFALHNWTERDLLVLCPVSTHDNNSDILTKSLGRQLFHRHRNYLLGSFQPNYSSHAS